MINFDIYLTTFKMEQVTYNIQMENIVYNKHIIDTITL